MSRGSARPHRSLAALLSAALALAAAAGAGCSRTADGPAPPARAQALLDSGNALYRAGDYAGAARRYGAAVVAAPDDPAAHYGLGMALARLGRDEDARGEYARARDLTQSGGAPASADSVP